MKAPSRISIRVRKTEYLAGSLSEVAKLIQTWIEQYGPEAYLDIDMEHEFYGNEYATAVINYDRVENDSEYKKRCDRIDIDRRKAERAAKKQKAVDLNTYKRIKKEIEADKQSGV